MKQFQILALLSALGLGSVASAAGFQNGSFETGTAPGAFTELAAGNGSITGWTIGGHSVDYIGSYWQASNGERSIDLSGGAAGSLAQSFDTLIGQTYTVTFDMAGNPDNGSLKSMTVSAAADSANYSFDSTVTSKPNMGWSTKSFQFTANSTTSTLMFASNENSAYGTALDNVSVQAVPEPATMAALGLGALGVLRRRNRK